MGEADPLSFWQTLAQCGALEQVLGELAGRWPGLGPAMLQAITPMTQEAAVRFAALVEVLAAQVNVGWLVLLSGWIAWEAVDRLRNPGPRVQRGLMAGVAAIGLLANLAILWVLQHERSLNSRSAFLHVLSVTVSSVAILAGAVVMGIRPDLRWIDPVLSLAIALLILWGAVRLILEITDILMESVPAHLDAGAIGAQMECCPGVIAVHDLHIWGMSTTESALTVHLVMPQGHPGDAFIDEVAQTLRTRFAIVHSTLQIEQGTTEHTCALHQPSPASVPLHVH
jgi:cobalt-zinc-cadmium efflux system protein